MRFVLALAVLMLGPLGAVAQPSYWVPTLSDTFQWDLEQPVQTDVNATVYDIDMFDNHPSLVAKLHAMGRHVICYIDVGSWESYRPDAKEYPKSILGKRYPHYPQERFVDIRALDVLGPILAARFDLCKRKGFDAIEPDNIDTYQANTGFPLTAQDELNFIAWLVAKAHERGLSIGQKNDPAQTPKVEGSFDWALLEECNYYHFCERFTPYIASGKAVFDTEYTNHTTVDRFLHVDCPRGAQLGFFLIYKHLSLNAYRVTCSGSVAHDDTFIFPAPRGRLH
jgi:hypothetical protein